MKSVLTLAILSAALVSAIAGLVVADLMLEPVKAISIVSGSFVSVCSIWAVVLVKYNQKARA